MPLVVDNSDENGPSTGLAISISTSPASDVQFRSVSTFDI